MEIILLQDVDNVGDKHEIVTVKDGYGRNYLIPKGLAIVANRSNRARLSEMRRREDALEMRKLGEYRAIAAKITEQVVRIGAKVGESGRIFGSVTNIQLAQAMREQIGVDVERKRISLPDDIKEVGTYKAVVNLHKEVQPELRFEVVAE
jgi:large subunit ribosomal protein L9